MKRCLRGKIISLTMVGLGGFLIGGAVGLALGKDEEERIIVNNLNISGADTDGDYIDEEVKQEYREQARKLYSGFSSITSENNLDNVSSFQNYMDDDDFEIIEHKTIVVDKDGEEVEMVNTTEGFVEVVEPYIISEEDYMDPNVFTEFNKNTLIYYEDDDTLATDRDEVVTEVEKLIGSSALTNFGNMSGNKDTVFVRNVKLSSDFEIVREQGSYKEVVLGLPEEDVEYEKAKRFFKNMDDDGK